MSPEDHLHPVREALARATEDFHSSLATTIDQVQALLPADDSADGAEPEHAALGDFASGRIDTARFASLVVRKRALEPATSGVIERALATLTGLAAQGETLSCVNVSPGESLHGAVSAALAQVGRAFGAARVIGLVRSGRYESSPHDRDLEGFPFARWNRAERRLAPPLLIEVDGADLQAGALTEFLDGAMRFVFLVRGACPPAPLARLISPGLFVMQCAEAADVARLAGWDGPGVAAIVPEGCARFVHDPAGGPEVWDRLALDHLPEEEPKNPVGGISVAQQVEQLRLLSAFLVKPEAAPAPMPTADAAAAPAGGGANGTTAEPADKLAAWLLASADL
ncbi:MAG: hypothetical protein ACYTCU_06375, partial [Planctomycetota bacterium]